MPPNRRSQGPPPPIPRTSIHLKNEPQLSKLMQPRKTTTSVSFQCRWMRRSRGCELPGTFNPLIVGDLFYQQSRPWRRLLERYSERILDATKNILELILLHTADEMTSDGLSRAVIRTSAPLMPRSWRRSDGNFREWRTNLTSNRFCEGAQQLMVVSDTYVQALCPPYRDKGRHPGSMH